MNRQLEIVEEKQDVQEKQICYERLFINSTYEIYINLLSLNWIGGNYRSH